MNKPRPKLASHACGHRLSCQQVHYQVRDHYLINNISFVSEANYRGLAILGANGAGKTTLLHLCLGLLSPSQGTVLWGEQPATQLLGRHIAMVFQASCLLRRSVINHLNYVVASRAIATAECHQRVAEVLELLQLEHLAQRASPSLSGGEQKRLMLASALVLKPAILLLDEPTAQLDMSSTKIVEQAIKKLQADGGKMVMTSHNPAQVRRLCDEVVFIDHGQLLYHADCQDFFQDKQHQPVICDFINAYALS